MGQPTEFIKKVTLQTTGLPESTLAERLGDIEIILKGAQLAFLPNQFGVRLRVTAKSESEEQVNNQLLEIEQKLEIKLADLFTVEVMKI